MKKLILVAAALFAFGCSQTAIQTKGTVEHSRVAPVSADIALASSNAAVDAVGPVVTEPTKRHHPSEHEMAVHRHHQEMHVKARNNDYWSVNKVRTDWREEELKRIVQQKIKSTVLGGVDEPSFNRVLTEKRKRETIRQLKAMRKAVMNSLDDPRPCYKNSLDIKPSDLNRSRMPGNGLVGMTPHDHYISKSECPNNRCVNSALTSRNRMKALGNFVD